MIKLNRHNQPFPSIGGAKMGLRHFQRDTGIEAKIIEIEGGFGLEYENESGEEAADTKPRRPKRVPIGTRNVLTAPQRKGYKRRFVNIDEDKEGWDRIERFQAAGYSIVEGEVEIGNKRIAEESQMGKAVIRSVGSGMKGILMEIPEDWHEEDQAEKHAAIDETEKAMKTLGEGQYGKIQIGGSPG